MTSPSIAMNEHFPCEILHEFFSYLTLEDLNRVTRTCKFWNRCADDLHVVQVGFRNSFPSVQFSDGSLDSLDLIRDVFNSCMEQRTSEARDLTRHHITKVIYYSVLF